MNNTQNKTAEIGDILDYEDISLNLDAISVMLQSMAESIAEGGIVEADKAIYMLSRMVLDESRNAKTLFTLAHGLQKQLKA